MYADTFRYVRDEICLIPLPVVFLTVRVLFPGWNVSQGQHSLGNVRDKMTVKQSSNTAVAARYQVPAHQAVLLYSYEVQLQWSVQHRARMHSGVLVRSAPPYVRLDAVLKSST